MHKYKWNDQQICVFFYIIVVYFSLLKIKLYYYFANKIKIKEIYIAHLISIQCSKYKKKRTNILFICLYIYSSLSLSQKNRFVKSNWNFLVNRLFFHKTQTRNKKIVSFVTKKNKLNMISWDLVHRLHQKEKIKFAFRFIICKLSRKHFT